MSRAEAAGGASIWQQLEARASEVVVERESRAEIEAAHQLEADVVDQGGAPSQRPEMSANRRVVEVCVDPGNLKGRHHVLEQCPHCAPPKAPVRQRLGLDQNVVVGDRVAVTEHLGHALADAPMLLGIPVEEGKKGRCIEEGQRAGRSAR